MEFIVIFYVVIGLTHLIVGFQLWLDMWND